MWKNVSQFLSADATLEYDATGEVTHQDALVATLAILLKAGSVSGGLEGIELERAIETLAHEFQLSDTVVREYTEVAHLLSKDETKLESLTTEIVSHFSVAQRVEILKGVWRVLGADREIEKDESVFAASARKLLGLSLEQAVFAQRQASSVLS